MPQNRFLRAYTWPLPIRMTDGACLKSGVLRARQSRFRGLWRGFEKSLSSAPFCVFAYAYERVPPDPRDCLVFEEERQVNGLVDHVDGDHRERLVLTADRVRVTVQERHHVPRCYSACFLVAHRPTLINTALHFEHTYPEGNQR